MTTSNGFYRTSNFEEAIFLRNSGIIYVRTEWPTPQRAFFIFKQPPGEVLSAWASGDDRNVRITMLNAEFLRDELRSSRS
jgi:hypothetical protein